MFIFNNYIILLIFSINLQYLTTNLKQFSFQLKHELNRDHLRNRVKPLKITENHKNEWW